MIEFASHDDYDREVLMVPDDLNLHDARRAYLQWQKEGKYPLTREWRKHCSFPVWLLEYCDSAQPSSNEIEHFEAEGLSIFDD